jgi:hypothetical protein
MCYDCMCAKLTQKDDAVIPDDTKIYVGICIKLHCALSVDDAVKPLNVLRYFYGTAVQGTFTFFGQSEA